MMSTTADQPVLDLLGEMTLDSIERSDLDPKTLMLVRLAALVAVQAPPASYVTNLAVAKDVGLTPEQIQSVLIAVSPIVGTPHVVAAIGNIARGLGMVIATLDEETE
jgi:alkylhydroperoxidase/carboxymuconolactone decarboxylase family protein YurZ